VVCYSLACLVWLHCVARDAVPVPVERVLLVAPPSPRVLEQHPEVTGFAPPHVTYAQLSAAAKQTRLVAGDDDPYWCTRV
jgi:predicted alpha/beta hydrolase family esterase